MEAFIITAILGIAIFWHFYNKNEMQREANNEYVKRLMKVSTKEGYDIWDNRLEGHVGDDEKKRRKANTKMLEDAENNRYLESVKSNCKIDGIDIWDDRLEGLVGIEEKNRRQSNSKMLGEVDSEKNLERLQVEANPDDDYKKAAIAINVEIIDKPALKDLVIRGCDSSVTGVMFSRSPTDIVLLNEESFSQSHELSTRIIKFFKGYPSELNDFINAVNLAMSNKKITKFGNLRYFLLSDEYSSKKDNLISYFLDSVVVQMGEFRRSYYRIDFNRSYGAAHLHGKYDNALAYFVSMCIVIGIGEKCALKYFRKRIKRIYSDRENGKQNEASLWEVVNDQYSDVEGKTIKLIVNYILKSKDPGLSFSRFKDDPKVATMNFQQDLYLNFELEGDERYLSRVVRKARDKIEKEILELDIEAEPESEYESIENTKLFIGTGLEYEAYMHARIERETPFNVELTKSSGDHGADLVIRKTGYSAVVQLKLYSTPVGNKAVQEAYTAKQHYHVGHAFVVTNSSYTRAAYEVAETTGVMLFQDEDFIEYLKSGYFV